MQANSKSIQQLNLQVRYVPLLREKYSASKENYKIKTRKAKTAPQQEQRINS